MTTVTKKTESGEQIALFDWIELNKARYPDLDMLVHIPNGGARDVRTGARLKREGVRAGYPDLFLAVPSYFRKLSTMATDYWNGFFIEMKAEHGALRPNQLEWHARLRQQGYHVQVCYSFEEARDAICAYLYIKPQEAAE